MGLLSYLLISRTDVETTVLRVQGQMFQRTPDGNISNLYSIQVINKTFDDIALNIKLLNHEHAAITRVGEATLLVPANGMVNGVYFVEIPSSQISKAKTPIMLGVYRGEELIEKVKTNFLGPITR
jgi:hypothetical protein